MQLPPLPETAEEPDEEEGEYVEEQLTSSYFTEESLGPAPEVILDDDGDCVQADRDGLVLYSVGQRVAASVSDNPVTPEVVLSAPSSVGLCDGATINGAKRDEGDARAVGSAARSCNPLVSVSAVTNVTSFSQDLHAPTRKRPSRLLTL